MALEIQILIGNFIGVFDVVIELRVPLWAIPIVAIEMLVGHFIEFRRVDCLPVAFEFLWIYLETVDPRYFRRTFYLFLRQKVSFSVGGERVHFLWSNEGVFLMNLSLRNVSEAIGPSQDKLSLSLQGHLLDLLIKRSGSLLLKVQTMTTFPMSLQVLRGPNMLILTLHKSPARLLISLLTSIDISLE